MPRAMALTRLDAYATARKVLAELLPVDGVELLGRRGVVSFSRIPAPQVSSFGLYDWAAGIAVHVGGRDHGSDALNVYNYMQDIRYKGRSSRTVPSVIRSAVLAECARRGWVVELEAV